MAHGTQTKTWLFILAISGALLMTAYNACSPSKKSGMASSAGPGGDDLGPEGHPEVHHKLLSKLPQGDAQRVALCKRGPKDRVRNLFCKPGAPPVITSLADLQAGVGLSFKNTPLPKFALLGHSSSLVMPEVSAINPRAVIFSPPDPDYIAMGYTRGLQLVEMAAGDPNNPNNLTFYLLAYTQDCNKGYRCRPAELLTPRTETNWRSVTVYDDEDLKNTIFDCRHCHQPSGLTGRRILRMQELELPWSHWMEQNLEGAKALLKDFHAAHGNQEDYAGIPANLIDLSNPPGLESLIRSLQHDELQLVKYDSTKILAEVMASSPKQPDSNEVPGKSATWNALYEQFVAGNVTQIPYHDEKVTDTTKLNKAITNYRSVIDGKLATNQLIDIRNVFPDDENILAEMGLRLKPGLTPQQMLMNGCAQCHNSKLDQTITKAKFDVNLSKMSPAAKQEAIRRINLPKDDLEVMPPPLFRTLRPEEISKLSEFLSK